ncbi:MAG: exosome complex protein Rrp42 [Candidatus Diapherotrites archaeon]|nr:exosome complex protein Rrp42 [Candidatus Diapherotrites archaeon]
MTVEDISWEIKTDYTRHLAKKKMREDKRKPFEYRKIELENGYIPNALGSTRVRLGKTEVIAGVSLVMGTPYPDKLNAGTLMTSVELTPIASPMFESGPPRPNAVEYARVVDRGIRESGTLDFEKLCVTEGEEVWMVILDLHVLDYNGNLFDAFALAAISALLNTKMPKYEDGKVIREETKGKLSVQKKPVECTFFKIGDMLMLDPSLGEDKALDARLTVATVGDRICAMQKGGNGSFTMKEIDELVDMSFKKSKELTKLL